MFVQEKADQELSNATAAYFKEIVQNALNALNEATEDLKGIEKNPGKMAEIMAFLRGRLSRKKIVRIEFFSMGYEESAGTTLIEKRTYEQFKWQLKIWVVAYKETLLVYII
jgi:hypothetical protein